jgi:hypothetical protein
LSPVALKADLEKNFHLPDSTLTDLKEINFMSEYLGGVDPELLNFNGKRNTTPTKITFM